METWKNRVMWAGNMGKYEAIWARNIVEYEVVLV